MYQLFPGKIIIFGEYSIITGSRAMVMPMSQFSGKLVLPDSQVLPKLEAVQSNYELRDFFMYLISQQDDRKLSLELDTCRMESELDKGIYFQSTIPVQYGVGSSAALVAAVYEAYSSAGFGRGTNNPLELAVLRKVFSEMESYFHGTSSGIDPLCSYSGRTLIIQKDTILPSGIPVMREDEKLFMLNSGLKAGTGSLVSDFKSRLDQDVDFGRAVREELTSLVERGIAALTGDSEGEENIVEIFRILSDWQFRNFKSLIPGSVSQVWKDGLNTGAYSLKLCGSGGGGFFLGHTGEWNKTKNVLTKSGLELLTLDY